ncbi:NADH-quinone oxidoreductase subunit G [Candidatus Ecksteinia adelgidicola]|nr:NADH-quinone oxidoreductase subunit G [Candidatus Ecksteinia adelgidicola]
MLEDQSLGRTLTMTIIYIEGKKYNAEKSDNLLETCLSFGFNIPYFCWHPALGSIGACRQCAIKKYDNEEDKHGRLVMSCMTPVSHGIFISINDKEVKEFRKNIIECLMINHPHDCPVCEEGGQCHLQDMTVMTGHNIRRYHFTKRTHTNQELGPFISHEMNRCITCYRCVRYYKDYADGTDFGVYGAHDNIYFGRIKNGILKNKFSGNLIEICPTGVFTDKTHSKNYNRKWDMQFSPSICQQCSIGCNISPSERHGKIQKIENRYHGNINYYFLCDLGRFGYGYVNRQDRPRQPELLQDNSWYTLKDQEALNHAVSILQTSKNTIGIGSSRASLESNFALRELVGSENYYMGLSESEQSCLTLILNILKNSGIYTPTLREIENYDAILILGEDLTQTAARIALSVRQAVKRKNRVTAKLQHISHWQIEAIKHVGQNDKYPLFITNVDKTSLDDISTWNYYAPLNDQARFAFAIAHEIDQSAPAVNNLDHHLYKKVNIIIQSLIHAKKPLIITGSHSGSKDIIKAASNIAKALKSRGVNVGITFTVSAVNSMGLAMMGGKSLDQALKTLTNGTADTAIVIENDLYRHASVKKIHTALMKVKNLIVVDHQRTDIMKKANLILSSASFAESSGTVVNQEGRAQRFFQVYEPSYYDDSNKNKITLMIESWRWMHALHYSYKTGKLDWGKLDDIISSCAKKFPELKGIINAAPNANFRIYGQKLARSPHRYSGRTAIRSNISVHEPCQPEDKDTMFSFSMEGNNNPFSNRQQIPFSWAPGWNSQQAWNKFQKKIGGNLLYGNPGIRLIQTGKSNLNYFVKIPTAFHPIQHRWRIAPYYHLFGSDEMSQRTLVIQQRMPKAYIMINSIDAINLKVKVGNMLEFSYEGQYLCLPVRISVTLSSGQIGLPLGLPGISPILINKIVDDLKKEKQ